MIASVMTMDKATLVDRFLISMESLSVSFFIIKRLWGIYRKNLGNILEFTFWELELSRRPGGERFRKAVCP